MAGLTWILSFMCVAGSHLLEASPVLRTALVVQAGQNVSLTCNLTSREEIIWFVLRSDQLLPLLTVSWNKFGETVVDRHTANSSRFKNKADEESGPVSLEIKEVEEEDAGLYFCSGRCEGVVCFNRGIRLAVEGVDGESDWRQPCFSLGVCVLPALLLFCFLCIVGFCLCSGKPAVCCCYTVRSDARRKVTEDVSLHYSSLKHADKPRPSGRGERGLVDNDVTYSTVAARKDRNVSHDHR
ncbi:uncharacterized protein LOC122970082 [Thunnus albacares]|uniref:uncharacterized protein LOC122970082 n=1 Tax=Thunnus albacares TaxID=8236 RepID=UPI001CF63379|nr:uncharacterized protein LOC122970082 [Thunnus albacares]